MGYDKRLLKATARRVKRTAAREKNKISWDQARELSITILDELRIGDMDKIDKIINENIYN